MFFRVLRVWINFAVLPCFASCLFRVLWNLRRWHALTSLSNGPWPIFNVLRSSTKIFQVLSDVNRFDTVIVMSTSGLLISNLPDRSGIKGNRKFRRRPKSCDEVLTQLNGENMYIPPSALPETSSTAPNEYRCLCAPTTHAGSFRCRLHRANFQKKQPVYTEPRLPPSLQTLPTLKLLSGDKHGRPDSSAPISLKAADRKLSRFSKMAIRSQMDCDSIPTEEVMKGPAMDDIWGMYLAWITCDKMSVVSAMFYIQIWLTFRVVGL